MCRHFSYLQVLFLCVCVFHGVFRLFWILVGGLVLAVIVSCGMHMLQKSLNDSPEVQHVEMTHVQINLE